MKKILAVFGTRPEAIKMAPLIKELQKHPEQFFCKVAVTAQHREMLDQVLELFDIRPDYDLDIMHAGQTLFDITRRVLSGLEEVLENENPDLVLVHGDTSTTCTAALASFYRQVPVGHVEAGLRTGNKYSPFPEEINRRITGVLADLHFAPTREAADNLRKESVSPDKIFITGNTVIDALLAIVRREYHFRDPVLESIDFENKRILLVTTHRRENLGQPLRRVYRALRALADEYPDIEIVFPVHKNPAVRNLAHEELGDLKCVHMIEPMEYEPFVNLMGRCYMVLTDSGGLQEEAPSLGKPVLVLRDTTERPEAVSAGTVKLVGTAEEQIKKEADSLLSDTEYYRKMSNAVNPYGDGRASVRIRRAIQHHFSLGERPRDYLG